MIEIKSWRDGSVLYTATSATDVRAAVEEAVRAKADLRYADLRYADLRSADLRSADLRSANLRSADLRYANLRSADLRSANLRSADLRSANLRSADLRSANLRYAKGVNSLRTTPLHILLDQPGKVRAYKLVKADGTGPFNGGITYMKGETVEVADANCDPNVQCAAGINVATLDWCLANWQDGYRVLVVEFTAKDIAAIPTASDGKFRVKRVRVVGEKTLAELGLEVEKVETKS